MGEGYLWSPALTACAWHGLGMAAVLAGLAYLAYWKRRKVGYIVVLGSLLALAMLGAASWLLYRGGLSRERVTLDRVDRQIMYLSDLDRRVDLLLDRSLEARGFEPPVPLSRLPEAMRLARRYLTELEQPVVSPADLEFLRQSFQVGVVDELEVNRRALSLIAGRLGLATTCAVLLLAVAFLGSRVWDPSPKAAVLGYVWTVVVFAVFLAHPFIGWHPILLYILVPWSHLALVLYVACRRASDVPVQVIGTLVLLLACGLFGASTFVYELFGLDDMRRRVASMSNELPKLQEHTSLLGEILDSLLESRASSEELASALARWQRVRMRDFEALGRLREDLAYWERGFDPYRQGHDRFRQAPLDEFSPP